jgi:hypothetical protein
VKVNETHESIFGSYENKMECVKINEARENKRRTVHINKGREH